MTTASQDLILINIVHSILTTREILEIGSQVQALWGKDEATQQRLIYEWVKTDKINRRQFVLCLNFIKGTCV